MDRSRDVCAIAVVGIVTALAAGSSAQRHQEPSSAPTMTVARRGTPSAGQIRRLEERIATANSLVQQLESEARARGRARGWRQATLESLLMLPLERLQQLGADLRSVDDLAAAIGDDPQTLGSSTEDLVFTPIVPCRYIDTRNIGGKITGTRGYDLALAGATYGGAAACNPTTLFGVAQDQFGGLAMNVTIVDPDGAPGFIAVKPTPAAGTSSLVNWYEAGSTVQVANQSIVTIDQDVATNDEFVIEASAAVHVIVDIFGAFIAPEATALDSVRLASAMVAIPAGGNPTQIASPSCPAGYTVSGGSCIGFATGARVYRTHWSTPNRWECAFVNEGAEQTLIQAEVICLRVPGR